VQNMNTRFRFRLLSIIVFLTATVAEADNYHVTAHGSWFCWDSSVRPAGAVVPLEGARVELMDSDCLGSEICDDVMGAAHVQADGSYVIDGVGGDPGSYSWSKPDVYVRVVFNDDAGVREADDVDVTRSANTPEHDHDNTDGDVDFGSWTTGLGVSVGDGNQCGVWLAARRAYQAYRQLVGSDPPAGHYDITYYSGLYGISPWSDRDTTHYPTHFPLNPFAPDPSDPSPSIFAFNSPTYAIDHEFGHTVRHSADGDRNHFNWDSTRFRYGRTHDHCHSGVLAEATSDREGAAFNEGWADFWAGFTVPCDSVLDPTVEGDVARSLALMAQCSVAGKQGLATVLIANPYAIHSLEEFRDRFTAMFPACSVGSNAQALAFVAPRNILDSIAARGVSAAESALAARSAALEHELSHIPAGSSNVRERCRSDRVCVERADQLIHRAMLAASVELVDWARQHVTRWKARVGDPGVCLECRLTEERREEFEAVRAAYEKAFDGALTAIDRLPKNKSTELAEADLRAKQARLAVTLSAGRLITYDSQLENALLGERVGRR
jgi:hypothetical protein